MKLSQLKEVRYVSPPKHAIDAWNTYEQFFNEHEDRTLRVPLGMIGVTKDITLVDRDYAETQGADFASIYLWVHNTDSDEKAMFKVKEFIERAGLPYTNITIDDSNQQLYHVTVSYREDKS